MGVSPQYFLLPGDCHAFPINVLGLIETQVFQPFLGPLCLTSWILICPSGSLSLLLRRLNSFKFSETWILRSLDYVLETWFFRLACFFLARAEASVVKVRKPKDSSFVVYPRYNQNLCVVILK